MSPTNDIVELILPQVPVEGIAVHIGRSRLSMGDTVTPKVIAEGKVGLWVRLNRPWAGIIPLQRDTYIGHLGDVASQILYPAVQAGHPLRMRVVVLTPEHLAGAGQPEIHVSVWGNPKLLLPFLEAAPAALPVEEVEEPKPRKAAKPSRAVSG